MIIAILTICLALRLIGLNQSLWLDEAISANVASNLNLTQIVANFSPVDFHPPFYYLFLNLWGDIFGWSEISLRMPSVLFSLISIYLVYLMGKKIKNENTGLWAALILGFNPLFVYYSQEARMYQMVTMFLTFCLFYFFKIIKEKSINLKDLIIFNLFSFLSFVTFYGSVFFLVSLTIYLIVKRKFKLVLMTNIGLIAAVLLLGPLLYSQIIYSRTALKMVTNWSLVLGKVNLKNLFLIPLKFSIGRISFYPKMFYYLVGGIWSLVVFYMALKKSFKYKIFIYILVTPIILGILFSIFSPLIQYFRFLYLLPTLALLISLSTTKNWSKLMVAGGFLIFSFIYLLNPIYYREDWKGLAKSLNKNEVVMVNSFADPVLYYNSEIKIQDLRDAINKEEINVIPYGEIIHGINHDEILGKQNYVKFEETNFRELKLEKWKLNH